MMEFDGLDVLKLDVETNAAGGLRNLIRNPSGAGGVTYQWLTPIEGSMMQSLSTGGIQRLRYTAVPNVANHFTTEWLPVTALDYTITRWILYDVNGCVYRVRREWIDAAGVVTQAGQSGYLTSSGVRQTAGTVQIPAGTVAMRFRYDLYLNTAGVNVTTAAYVQFYEVTTAVADTAAALAAVGYILPVNWLSIIAPAHAMTVDRAPLDVSTIALAVRDVALDPSQSDVVRPGKLVRLSVGIGGVYHVLFESTIRTAKVTYDLKRKAAKRALVELTATDAATKLANVKRSGVVANITELPAMLEDTGVPWQVNGSGTQSGTAPDQVAQIENATALDQVGLTRDNNLGQAWVDRSGVLQVWLANLLPATLSATLDESAYSDVQIDYDMARCINVVTVKFLRTNPDTNESEEVTYGPYVDQESVDAWGPFERTFTIARGVEDDAEIAAYAQLILDANAVPKVQIQSVLLPIRKLTDLSNVAGQRRALIDLLDAVRVVNADAGIDETMRVQGVRHVIAAKSWQVELLFVSDGAVAAPATVPSPDTTKGKTLAQLLRPIGEVTMWWGTPAQLPEAWMIIDGSAYSSSAYPDLFAFLGVAVLPDFNDRVPVGASLAKPHKSAGGSEDRSVAAHAHSMTHSHSMGHNDQTNTATGGTAARVLSMNDNTGTLTGNTGTGGAHTFNVLQPFRALYFIMRVK